MDEATYQILHYSKVSSPFLLSFNRISPNSLQISSSFSSLLLKHGAFHMRFHLFCFSILAPFF
jgi:hypothetical protein